MKLKLDRIISIATLLALIVAITVMLRKPAPVAQPQTAVVNTPQSAAVSQNAAQPSQELQANTSSDSSKPAAGQAAPQSPAPTPQSTAPAAASAKTEMPSADGLSAMIAKTLGGASAASLSPESNVGSGEPNIKDQQVTMDGDVVHGKFLTEIGGKDVWVTISGHMGEKDGYATFDPTEFKVGDTEVPVSLVNPLLQKKLAEERDRLKVPNN
jgi:ABC-type uncharacterized transport system involved in gliding motility auxiliary subunit